ncbi:DUF4126 domain-containing protein [Luteococcus japonicus]|nr:DUF4126 domain-containing protein [Luteococcus japonicus]
MELLPMTFATGWASGLNAWATVLVLGLLGRFANVGEVPLGFQRTDVLAVMAVLATIELLADKIPLVDSTWDAASTVVRPVAGAVIAALIAGNTGSLTTITLAGVGGVSALLSHITKSGLRLAINTSPEPVSNVTASVANDVSLVAVLSLAAEHPVPAAVAAGVILLVGLVLFALVFAQIRRGVGVVRRNLARLRSGGAGL